MTDFISKETFKKLEEELRKMKLQRREVADRLKRSAGYGDITENAEYQQAREDKETLETKIIELEQKIKNAVIKEKSHSSSKISFYSSVKVRNDDGVLSFTLVSPEDSNFKEGKISYESPLGKELLGKQKGDKIKVMTPAGQKNYQILSIS